MSEKTFAQIFSETKIEKDVTFREISKQVGISIGYLCDFAQARRNPPAMDIVVKMEQALGLTDGRLQKAAALEHSRTPRGMLQAELESLRAENAKIKQLLAYFINTGDNIYHGMSGQVEKCETCAMVVRAKELLEGK
jgi:transcriptional regulator with XRE-family HTH domain